MADKKISALTASSTPLAGTEVLPIVQSSTTKQVSVANLTAGRAVSATSIALNGAASALTPAFIRNGSFSCSSFGADKQLATFGAYNDDLTNGGFVFSALVTDVVTEVARGGTAGLTVTSGNLIIGTAGKGIDFSATSSGSGTMTSELLADYEEGTWTPVLSFATAGDLSVTYSNQIGTYVKIGRAVILTCRITASAFTHSTASGALRITGMPFSAASRHYSAILFNGINKLLYTTVVVNSDTGSSILTFSTSGMGQSQTSIAVADVPTAGTPFIQFTLCYETAS